MARLIWVTPLGGKPAQREGAQILVILRADPGGNVMMRATVRGEGQRLEDSGPPMMESLQEVCRRIASEEETIGVTSSAA